ncbi:MAG TPA: hypothetical protein VNK41_12815, partial [Vicinamibacterales bacterium]|nr:hypothetical protein [Vicinamibacterales bacterium]
IVDQQALIDRLIENAGPIPPEFEDALEQAREASRNAGQGPLRIILSFIMSLGVNLVFATLGGLLGAVLFRKDAGPSVSSPADAAPPVQPPGF